MSDLIPDSMSSRVTIFKRPRVLLYLILIGIHEALTSASECHKSATSRVTRDIHDVVFKQPQREPFFALPCSVNAWESGIEYKIEIRF